MNIVLKKIAAVYKYIFYKLYRWSGNVNILHEPNELQAIVMLSLSIAMYLLALEALLQLFSMSPRDASNNPEKDGAVFAIIFYLTIFLINFYFLKYKIGFKKIISEFDSEDIRTRRIGNVLVTLYVIGSFVLPVTLWFIIAMQIS